MREVVLDGKMMKNKTEMHDYLKAKFYLPYYYARTLDSLYQILSKDPDPMHIVIKNKSSIARGYGDTLVLLLRDLSIKNPNYTFELKDDDE